jgi:hypothetical protein
MKISLAAIIITSFALLLAIYGSSNLLGTADNTFNSIYHFDRDNDGIFDSVYQYTYDINGNEIKVEIDSDNDGVINEVYCYNLIADIRN